MKIIDVERKQIEACVTFEYKGFEISASTIFRSPSVFVCDLRTHEFVSPEMETIENAINWVENNNG